MSEATNAVPHGSHRADVRPGSHGASAGAHGAHGSHGSHDPTDDAHDHDEGPHSTLKGYVTGFVLSVILTAIPFWIVMAKVFENPSTTALVVLAFAAVQIVVHMVYFLHMDSKVEAGWSMLALIFTVVLVVITLSGSLWVMYHLKHNMMPMSTEQMRNSP